MSIQITDQWIIETMQKNEWCLNSAVFIYPEGLKKEELKVPEGEKVCASITDVFYLSTQAVYLRDKAGKYTRLKWSEIDDAAWSLRKVKGQTVQAINYKSTDGCNFVRTLPFTFVPKYFADVHEMCIAELTPSGKKCRLPGPLRLKAYARPVSDEAAWARNLQTNRIVWLRELACPCNAEEGFALRFLGKLLKDGLIADGKMRQCIVAECKACGDALEVFDSFRHGYNAVICLENQHEPPGRQANTAYKCRCGINRFLLGVVAVYDTETEDLAGFRKGKRSEAYGWFSMFATCRSCGEVTQVIDFETA